MLNTLSALISRHVKVNRVRLEYRSVSSRSKLLAQLGQRDERTL